MVVAAMTDTALNARPVQKARLLFEPFLFGDLKLSNRIVMAPLTRMRASDPGGKALVTDSDELMVPHAKFLRDQAGPDEALFVSSFNDQLEAPQLYAVGSSRQARNGSTVRPRRSQ